MNALIDDQPLAADGGICRGGDQKNDAQAEQQKSFHDKLYGFFKKKYERDLKNPFSYGNISKDKEMYRSGRNENDSKSFCP